MTALRTMQDAYRQGTASDRVRKAFAWTGHRPELFLDIERAREAVDAAASEVARGGSLLIQFLVGGQRGVDTWAAQAALRLGVPYTLVLPLEADEFAAGWADIDRRALDEQIARAAEVRVAGGYSARNRVLATSADELIAVWTGTTGGGTAETISFARAAGTPIREILLEPAADAGHPTGRGI